LSANDLAVCKSMISPVFYLKDASAAALYGARGANGVIAYNAKEGKIRKAKINIRAESSFQTYAKHQLADPITT